MKETKRMMDQFLTMFKGAYEKFPDMLTLKAAEYRLKGPIWAG